MSSFSIFSIPPTKTDDSQWLHTQEEIDNSPSILAGHSKEMVQHARDVAVDRLWKLKDYAQSATVYTHRFYMLETIDDYDPVTLATAAFYLAGKVEEHFRNVKSIVSFALGLDRGFDPESLTSRPKLDENESDFIQYRKKLVFYEEVMLRRLAMDLTIRQPQWSLLKGLNQVWGEENESEMLEALKSVGWKFINDSMSSTLSIRHPPNVIAAASVVLACAYKDTTLPSLPPSQLAIKLSEEDEDSKPSSKSWIDIFEVSSEDVKDAICIILENYERAESRSIKDYAEKWNHRASKAIAMICRQSPLSPLPKEETTGSSTKSTSILTIKSEGEIKPHIQGEVVESDFIITSLASTSKTQSIAADAITFPTPNPVTSSNYFPIQTSPPLVVTRMLEDVDMFSNNESPRPSVVQLEMNGIGSNNTGSGVSHLLSSDNSTYENEGSFFE